MRCATKRRPAKRYAALAHRIIDEMGYRVVAIGDSAQIQQVHSVKRQMKHHSIDFAGHARRLSHRALARANPQKRGNRPPCR